MFIGSNQVYVLSPELQSISFKLLYKFPMLNVILKIDLHVLKGQLLKNGASTSTNSILLAGNNQN